MVLIEAGDTRLLHQLAESRRKPLSESNILDHFTTRNNLMRLNSYFNEKQWVGGSNPSSGRKSAIAQLVEQPPKTICSRHSQVST